VAAPLAKRVLVIGARGELGTLTTRAFEGAGWEVRPGSRRPRSGEVRVDVDQAESAAAIADGDELVVNTVPHRGLLVERAVLERGGVAINVSGLPAAAGRALRAAAGGARGTVLMNAGLVPGVSNLVAAELLRAHPHADELEIVLTLSAAARRGPAAVQLIRRGLTTVSRHRTVSVSLPEPFGERECVGFAETDAGWLGGIAEGRLIRVYICLAEPEAHALLLTQNRSGRVSRLPKSPIGWRRPVSGARPDDEPVAHWVAAKFRGRVIEARTLECHGHYLHAAHATVVFAEALLARPQPAGCLDPEELLTLSDLEAPLLAAGIAIVSRGQGTRTSGDAYDRANADN